MKKLLTTLLCLALAAALLAGCGAPAGTPADTSSSDTGSVPAITSTIKVGASPTPHAEILAYAKDLLAAEGIALEIVEFTDYVQPNLTLESGDLDANYFQHKPYLDNFNVENKTNLVSIAAVHYEPLGLYPGKTTSLDALADGAQIAVPNDPTNEARALLLLESLNFITVSSNAGLNATPKDILSNPKNLKIVELEAAQLARSLPDVAMAVINGNYAIQAGLNAATDALAKEEADSLAAETFANILVVRAGDENRPELVALANVLKSDAVKQFIADKYAGAVVAMN